MTDLFISTSAVILMSIALSQPESPVETPIQADLFVLCPPPSSGGQVRMMPAGAIEEIDGKIVPFDTSTAVPVPTREVLVEAIREMPEMLAERSLLTVAIVNVVPHEVTAPCLRTISADIFGAYNLWLLDLPEKPGLPPMAVTMALPGLPTALEAADAGN